MHILIVEDDPVVADGLGMNSYDISHVPNIAQNIQVALAELRQNDHNDINAILLDINLPDGG